MTRILGIPIFFLALAVTAFGQPYTYGIQVCESDLIAGNNGPTIGHVRVLANSEMPAGEFLRVEYDITDPNWSISTVHLAVTDDVSEIPQTKNGNPKIGQFPISMTYDPAVQFAAFDDIDWGGVCGNPVYVAAHAVVTTTEYEPDPTFTLPAYVDLSWSWPGSGGPSPSYFDVTVFGGTTLDGLYDGWCIDEEIGLLNPPIFGAAVFSSYDPGLPSSIVYDPANLDQVNWILNQGLVGMPSIAGGNYTYGDVQLAIWALIDDTTSLNGIGPSSGARVLEILAAAGQSGVGFYPTCGETLGVILVPPLAYGTVPQQPILIEVPLPCIPVLRSETAWGDGMGFSGSSWATYMTCVVPCSGS